MIRDFKNPLSGSNKGIKTASRLILAGVLLKYSVAAANTITLQLRGFTQSAYSELTNADGRLRVSVETGSGLTDNELRATAVPVSQVSGANWSVYATGFGASGS